MDAPITDIMGYLRDRLRLAGSRNWPALADAINAAHPPAEGKDPVGEPLLRKIAYGDRDNPGVATVQPVLSFFDEVDRGERELPKAEAVR